MNHPFDIPADLDTPTSVYLKLGPLRPRFLLESVEHGDRIGRFSFIGFGDGLEVTSDGHAIDAGSTRIETDGTVRGLMDGLRKVLAAAPTPGPVSGSIPFAGGLVGAVGFDVAHRLAGSIPPPSSGVPEILLYGPPSVIVFDHLSRRAALLHDGPEEERLALRDDVISLLAAGVDRARAEAGFSDPVPSMTQGEYLEGVESAREHIAAGDVYQLVLSVNFAGETDLDPFDVYRGLRLLNPSPYMYFCELGDTKVIGSSPEALVRLRGSGAELRPIAGTRPRYNDDETDRRAESELLDDAKEAAEHVMLVDLARNDLGRVAVPGSIRVDPYRAIERYSHVMHLVSGVTGVLEPGVRCLRPLCCRLPGRHRGRGTQSAGPGAARGAGAGHSGDLCGDRRVLRARREHGPGDRDPDHRDERRPLLLSGGSRDRRRQRPGDRVGRGQVQGRSDARRSGERGGWAVSRVLLVDNYDSFTYNVVQALRILGAEVIVRTNDDIDLRAARDLAPTHLVISPGPGRPESAGESMSVIEGMMGEVPILGVCLGHQALAAVLGGRVERAAELRHGKSSPVYHDSATIYAGLPNPFEAGRYHSLAVKEDGLPEELVVTAFTSDGEIMGVRHREFPVEGVQFHPESLLTPHGDLLLRNFLDMTGNGG